MLIRADARAIPLVDGSMNCCVTSPPYWGLRDYGIANQIGLERDPQAFIDQMVAVFREVWRVLRDDGTLWLNLGDSYCSAGGTGHQGKHGQRCNRTHTQRSILGRTAGGGLKPKDLVGMPWRVALALQSDGWYLRSDIIWHKPNPMPESVYDRPSKSHEYLFLLAKSQNYYYDGDSIREPVKPKTLTSYGTRQNRTGDSSGLVKSARFSKDRKPRLNGDGTLAGANKRSVWTVPSHPFPGSHFATFPPKLIEPCILAGCPPGGLVFDPFVGTGTTVEVANRLGRRGVGCDLSAEYLHDFAAERIKTQMGLQL